MQQDPEHYIWGDGCEAWFLLKSETLHVIRERMPPGSTEMLHCHRFATQLFYILSGDAAFEINETTSILAAGESIFIHPRTIHRVKNEGESRLEFLLVSEPPSKTDRINILPYAADLKDPVRLLNVEWLEKYFRVEPNDIIQLSDPQGEIIDKGGMIFYASEDNQITGTASLLKITDDCFELGKMAVTALSQGKGIGNILMVHCINVAKRSGIKKLVLYSNRSLLPAIALYRKYGFSEVPMEAGHYDRANIKMERIV